MRFQKTIASVTAATGIVIGLTACGPSSHPSSNTTEHNAQSADSKNLVNNQPVPIFKYSQARQTLKDAESIAADGTQTTTFFYEGMSRTPVFECNSIGVPVPDSASLTNPTQIVHDSYPTDNAAIPIDQMEPYGIYAPTSSTGTFVLCVNGSGKTYLVRWEGTADAFTAGATFNKSTGMISVDGAPTANLHDKFGNSTSK